MSPLPVTLAIATLFMVAGCATPKAEPPPDGKVGQNAQNCTRVYKVGSNIPTYDCSTPATDQERQMVNEEMRRVTRPASVKPPGT